jgi:hypothetical protein
MTKISQFTVPGGLSCIALWPLLIFFVLPGLAILDVQACILRYWWFCSPPLQISLAFVVPSPIQWCSSVLLDPTPRRHITWLVSLVLGSIAPWSSLGMSWCSCWERLGCCWLSLLHYWEVMAEVEAHVYMLYSTLLYPPQRSCMGVYWFHHVRPSVDKSYVVR